MGPESLGRRAERLIVGMSEDRVRTCLGQPLRVETLYQNTHARWYYPEGLEVHFGKPDDEDEWTVTRWAWRPSHCPTCGKPLGKGATRCWARGCDYSMDASVGTVPFIELPDGRTVMAHWIERPKTLADIHGNRKQWTLTLENTPFRLYDRDAGQWRDAFDYGKTTPIGAASDRAPDGRFQVRYHVTHDVYYHDAILQEVELVLDVEKMEITYRVIHSERY